MKMLTIDLSTTCTGWSLWNTSTKILINFGFVKPSKRGLSKLVYPRKQLEVMKDLALKIAQLVQNEKPDLIVIEEVNLHKSRMTGKTLDGAHWITLLNLSPEQLATVRYRDSDGPTGWRTRLNLRLTESDKKVNAERKKINKKKVKGTADLPIITKKHLAARHVNEVLGTSFDVDANATDNDVVDAIGLGLAELMTM